ncbi:MAG: dienelactone hydrolase family protein, partial [Planctomycetota bacterium]|nr:dienelactone hydrolase family protein [Planctomycetota bacterium]
GPIEDTCRALARAGLVGYAPIRRKTISMNGHLNDVLEGVRHASKLKKVDATKIGMIGFSRGGLLTYLATIRNPDMRAAIILAPAHGRGALEASLQHSNRVRCPILILISENDNTKFDLVSLSSRLEQALKSADKTVQRIVYPPFENDGHRRFFTIGSYWNDVESFLRQHLSTPPGRND